MVMNRASKSLQCRIDDLVDDLELSIEQRAWIIENNRRHPKATRVANLITEYLDARGLTNQQATLKMLFEAVQAVKIHLQAEALDLPSGHVLISEKGLRALRDVAVTSLLVGRAKGSRRAYLLNQRLRPQAEVAAGLDPVVSEEAETEENE